MFEHLRKICGDKNPHTGERGETQLGIIVGGLVLGVGCSIFFTLQSCVKDYKDSKVINRRQQLIERYKTKQLVDRTQEGYTVSY